MGACLLYVGYATAAGADELSDAVVRYKAGDWADALKVLRPLAEQGNSEAQRQLGKAYQRGQGVPQDYSTAVTWYRKAAEQGNADSQVNLGVVYALGQGVPQDYSTAVAWFRKAAEQGNSGAQSNLGLAYQLGKGVPQDLVRAYMWWNLAASGPDNDDREKIAKNRDVVAAMMTPAQIAEAQALSRDWTPNRPGTSTINSPAAALGQKSVPMALVGGTYAVPVGINNVMTLDFIVDSGAAYVSVPSDVVSTLVRSGTLQASDFIGQETFVLADGSQVPSATFRIRSLKVGDVTLENVVGSVANAKGSLLLGQSFLGRFQSWSIDNASHALMLGDRRP